MKIIKDETLLRKKCIAVTKEDEEMIKKTVNNMIKIMLKNGAVGIAAPQVGIYKTFFVVLIDKHIEIFINPQIILFSDEKTLGQEGCLSNKYYRGMVWRSKEIKVRYFDDLTLKEKIFTDKAARYIQHEYDHLYGVLYTDKAEGQIRKLSYLISNYRALCNIVCKISLIFKIKNIKISLQRM